MHCRIVQIKTRKIPFGVCKPNNIWEFQIHEERRPQCEGQNEYDPV
jgi:hypothetical protein